MLIRYLTQERTDIMPLDATHLQDTAEIAADDKRFDVVLSDEHARNLLECARMLETDDHVRDHWDYMHVVRSDECGTSACAVGSDYLRCHPDATRLMSNSYIWNDALTWSKHRYGLTTGAAVNAWHFLFQPGWNGLSPDTPPDRVARRIRRFVANHARS